MDYKKRVPDSFDPTEVAPLPSAPPPSYDDAMGISSGSGIQQSIPVMAGNPPYNPMQPPLPAYPIQSAVPPPQPYPVQQMQTAPATGAALSTNRYLPVGRHPLKTTCIECNTSISTRIRTKNSCTPTCWCIVLFLTGVCLPFSCCPYFCCDKPLRVEHFCPRCNAYLGTYVDAS